MKKLLLILLLLPTFFETLCAEKHRIKYRYGSGSLHPDTAIEQPLRKVQVFGERCSGSTFLEQLVRRNFKGTELKFFYGMKHFPCWFDHPYDEEFYQRPLSHYTLEGSDEVLFLVIFRDPYDWLRSFHRKPYFAIDRIRKMNFSDFIRTPWLVAPCENHPWIPAFELNPATRTPFANVMKLRTARILNMLRLKDLVKYVYFINYEILKENPKAVLEEIRDIFGLELNEEFVAITDYKGNSQFGVYKGSSYPPISSKNIKFINANLNHNVERAIGYVIKSYVFK